MLDRRHFLQTTTLAVASVATPWTIASAAPRQSATAPVIAQGEPRSSVAGELDLFRGYWSDDNGWFRRQT